MIDWSVLVNKSVLNANSSFVQVQAAPLLPPTPSSSRPPHREVFIPNLLSPLPLPPPSLPQVLSKAEAFGIDNLLNDSPLVQTLNEEQGDGDEKTSISAELEPRIPSQISITSEELAVCVKGILLSTMTWISTFRPDRQLLRIFLQPSTCASTTQLTPREIACLMSTAWPRVFTLEAIESSCLEVDFLTHFLCAIGGVVAKSVFPTPPINAPNGNASERIESLVRYLTDLQPSTDEFSLLKTLCLFSMESDSRNTSLLLTSSKSIRI
ncbi:hypothetical protein TcWFU_009652 [Taenia crassiceps]|uniref:NR LBD domain-containing protein n=1 Tax=Taenia crassiceps TaxID=6207 RepID=A0ABR4Q4R2_9CEST